MLLQSGFLTGDWKSAGAPTHWNRRELAGSGASPLFPQQDFASGEADLPQTGGSRPLSAGKFAHLYHILPYLADSTRFFGRRKYITFWIVRHSAGRWGVTKVYPISMAQIRALQGDWLIVWA